MTDSKTELQTLKNFATSENLKFVNDIESVVKHLRNGVSFPVAANIINTYWGDSAKGKQLKLKLSSSDLRVNGETILHTNIDREDILKIVGERKGIYEYFTAVHAYINDRVDTVLEGLHRAEFNEVELACYNEFRKEVVRYLDYINNYFWDIRTLLEKEDTTCWTQLGIPTAGSDDGDYLFFDSFKEDLDRQHKVFMENFVDLKNIDNWYSLSSCEHFANRLTAQIKLPYLFACWLDEKSGNND